tara:strand:- start:519 stop:815 length:297 start_codon:yes stop_codon:yes gene_type:complete
VENNLTKEQKEEIIKKFHTLVLDLIQKYDSPETVYLMARALSITAIMKAEKEYYGFLTMQNALNDTAQELIALGMGEPPTQGDEIFEPVMGKNKQTIH